MRQILIIAKQTFRESVRNKILFIFIFLSLIAVCSSIFMPAVGDGREKIQVIESACLSSITFFGMLAAILLSASSIPSDIEDKLLWTITTKPISRINLILGKILGFIYIIILLVVIMGSASYLLIKLSAIKLYGKNSETLSAREQIDHSGFHVAGNSAKKIGDIFWIEGGENGASVWDIKGLSYSKRPNELEIETKLFVESSKKSRKKIPINIKIVNSFTGSAHTETIEVFNNKFASLKINSKTLEGSKDLKIVITPKNSGDFIGVRSNSMRAFWGKKSFEYNLFKALIIISSQIVLMIILAMLGSTFLSLPVNILFCLFIFFCGNIIDFMRDLSTVINLFGGGGHEHDHEHGMSAFMKMSNTLMVYLNHIVNKPILFLSYVLPNFKEFNVNQYFLESISIPFSKIYKSFGYTILYALVCLPLSFLIFKRREIA